MSLGASPGTYQGQVDLKYPWEGPGEVSIALLSHSYLASYFSMVIIGRFGDYVCFFLGSLASASLYLYGQTLQSEAITAPLRVTG